MINNILPQNASLLEQLARFTEIRQHVLAGNVANIDTPGYRPRDLPVAQFQQALTAALAGQSKSAEVSGFWPPGSSVSSTDQAKSLSAELFQAADADAVGMTFHDGARRGIETEINEMTKNSMLHQYAVELLLSQYRMLETALGSQR